MSLKWDDKDPNEVLDYDIDWSDRLDTGDTISTSTWVITGPDSALIKDSDSHTDTVSKIWLSAGTVTATGVSYSLRNRVVTTGGRTMDQTVKLRIREK